MGGRRWFGAIFGPQRAKARSLAVAFVCAALVAACGGQGGQPSSAAPAAPAAAPPAGSIEANPYVAKLLAAYCAGTELPAAYATITSEAVAALRGAADYARTGGTVGTFEARAFIAALLSGEGMADGTLRAAMAAAKASLYAAAMPDYVKTGALVIGDFEDITVPALAPAGAVGCGDLRAAAEKTVVRAAVRGSAMLCARAELETGKGRRLYCLFAGAEGAAAWFPAEELRFAPYDAAGGTLALALREGGGLDGSGEPARRIVFIGKGGERTLLGEGALELGSETGAPDGLDMLAGDWPREKVYQGGGEPIGAGDYAISRFHGFGLSAIPGCAAAADLELVVDLAREPFASVSGRVEVHFEGPRLQRYCAVARELRWKDGRRDPVEYASLEGDLIRDGAALVLRRRSGMAGGDERLAFARFVGRGEGLEEAWTFGLTMPGEMFGSQDHNPYLGRDLYPAPGAGGDKLLTLADGDESFAAGAEYVPEGSAAVPGLWLEVQVGRFTQTGQLPMGFETRATGWLFLGRESIEGW